MPISSGLAPTGSFYERAARLVLYRLLSNVTPVSLTNPTAATDLMTFALPQNPLGNGCIINETGRGLDIFACGTYNLAASSTVVFTIKLGTVTIATFTTASQTNTSVTLNWQLRLRALIASVGSAGTLETHGALLFDSGATLPAAASVFLDGNTGVSAAIDLTLNPLLEIMANFGTGNASSVIAQRVLDITLLN
jgi:hypothetical protein